MSTEHGQDPSNAELLAAFRDEIQNVVSVVDTRLTAIDDRFDAIDTRFDIVDKRIDALTLRFDGTFVVFDERMDNMEVRMGTMEREMVKTRTIQLDMQDDLTSALAAVDRDTEKLYDHERRIGQLEKSRA
jgi:hypothetical protein